jgi:uncharacterized protein YbjT (DUF2867 family)
MVRRPSDILVCGATGFVGKALTERLVRDGQVPRVLTRRPEVARASLPAGVEVFEGEAVEGTGLDVALEGVSLVYYLIHSMGDRPRSLDFAESDRRAASNFSDAARRAGVDRIIYLGGLGDDAPASSNHLASRREVGRILRSGPAAVTQLRAGIVVGPGGASFEMMVQLVERLPLMICPRWIDRRCQPIALPDLVEYLVGCRRESHTRGETYDVGGPDVLRYSEMLMRVGHLVHRPPCLVILPRFTPGLSAHWVGYITEVSPDLARPIIDGMYVDAVCRDDRIRQVLPIPLQGFDSAVSDALAARARTVDPPRLRGGHPVRPFEGRILRLTRGADFP